MVMVTATDAFGAMATAEVTIKVTDVDEDPSITTTAEADTAISFAEKSATPAVIATALRYLCSYRPRARDDKLGCVGA